MRDIDGNSEQDIGHAGFVSLALEVIERLARRLDGVGELQTEVLDRLTSLSIQRGSGVIAAMLDSLQAARVPSEQAVSLYIPEIARVLGRGWEDDRYSFAEVTIGSARLQELLHHFQSDLTADSVDARASKSALVLVPPGEQHTLGALVVAMLLRQKGISVSIRIGPAMSDLSRLLGSRQYDAALVSVANTDKVETAVKIIRMVKTLSKGRIRVAAGGAGCARMRDALVSSGVDLISDDLEAVVSGFSLQEHAPDLRLARR